MKITALIENTAARDCLAFEHGLSLLIETGKHRILFDAGDSGAFADNAKLLGVDLESVDIAVLSHGHYDHGGGLARFLEINRTAPVYVSRHAFGSHYDGKDDRYIGLDRRLEDSDRIILTGDELRLDDGLFLYSCSGAELVTPIDSSGLCVKKDGAFCPEDFCHEQYLLIEEGGKRYLFSGCSHKGILNIMNWFSPDVFVGGFHFMNIDPDGEERKRLDEAVKVLLSYHTVYYTGHCTGIGQYRYMKERMGDRLHYLSGGTVVTV